MDGPTLRSITVADPAEPWQAAGFAVDELAHDRLHKAPPWVRPLIVGVAQAGA